MKNILIIEDERTFANIVGELIQDEGFTCHIAYSVADAEKYFPKLGKEIQIVILDLMMVRTGSFETSPPYKGETGDELYERIRAIAPEIKIVIMTAKTQDNLKSRYLSEKNTRVFFKPIDPGMIVKLITILKNL